MLKGDKAEVRNDVILELAPGLSPNWGPTLADLRTRLGGSDQGTFTDPRFGTKHAVDLRPWTHLPPQTRFVLHFHYPVPESHSVRRRLAVESLLTSGMPFVMDEARTLDELLDTGLETQDLEPQSDGTFKELDWRMRTARQMFGLMPNPPSRRRLLRALSRLTDSGEVFRTGTGTRHDPYRYWRDAQRGFAVPGRPATKEESQRLWSLRTGRAVGPEKD
jgi:hypothetical protein